MSLIHCNECGREYSNMSSVCIHCGYPTSMNVGVVDTGIDSQVPITKTSDLRNIIGLSLRILTVFFVIRIIALSVLSGMADEIMDESGVVGMTDLYYVLYHPSYDKMMTVLKVAYFACFALFSGVSYLLYKSNLENRKIYYVICITLVGQYLLGPLTGALNVIGPTAFYIIIHIIIATAAISVMKYEKGKLVKVRMIIVLFLCFLATCVASVNLSNPDYPVIGLRDSFDNESLIVFFYIIIVNLFVGSVKRFKFNNLQHSD